MTETTATVSFDALTPAYLGGAVTLSRAESVAWAESGDTEAIAPSTATPPTLGACSPSCSPAAPAPFSASTRPRRAGSVTGLRTQGLAPVGGGIAMFRGAAPATHSESHTFAVAAQALG